MKQVNNSNLKIINEQILATTLFIVSLLISLSLAYNQKMKVQNNEGFYSDEEARKIAIGNRIFIVLIVLFYLYIDKENLDYNSNEQNQKYRKMQCYLEVLYLLAAIIALYITIKSTNITTEIENPNI